MIPVQAESLEGESAIRQLKGEDVFLLNDNNNYVETGVYTIYDMVDIQLSSKSVDDVEPVKVNWSMKDFNGQTANLQMNLDKLREDNVDLQVYDNLEISLNDGQGVLKSESGKQVEFGKTVEWNLSVPFVQDKEITSMRALANFWIALICLAVMITFVLALFKGSLVQTWMLINTLQLVAHLPLIATKMPANAHYFLINLLGVVRLHFDQMSAAIDNLDSKLKEYEILSDENSFFTASMNESGYHISFTRNTLFILTAIMLITLVWAMTAIVEWMCCRRAVREGQRSKLTITKEVFMNNFMVRFLYEVFFELVLCALINLSASASSAPGGNGTWTLSMITLIVGTLTILAFSCLYLRNGPYLKDTYEKGRLCQSLFKGLGRPLSTELQSQVHDAEDKPSVQESYKKALESATPIGPIPERRDRKIHYRQDSDVPLNQHMFSPYDMPAG